MKKIVHILLCNSEKTILNIIAYSSWIYSVVNDDKTFFFVFVALGAYALTIKTKDIWEIGFCQGNVARRHRINGTVQFRAGDGKWTDWNVLFWSQFKSSETN